MELILKRSAFQFEIHASFMWGNTVRVEAASRLYLLTFGLQHDLDDVVRSHGYLTSISSVLPQWLVKKLEIRPIVNIVKVIHLDSGWAVVPGLAGTHLLS
jgi:hypothetical protein